MILFFKGEKNDLSVFFKESQKTKGLDSKLSKFCHSYKRCYNILFIHKLLINILTIRLSPNLQSETINTVSSDIFKHLILN